MAGELWGGDTYREQCIKFIRDSKMDISGKWNYQFGIYTGTTLQHIYRLFRILKVPAEKILAFDSFEGLPDEKPGLPKHENWNRSEFNMRYCFQTKDDNEIIRRIEAELPDHDISIQWFKGWFCDVLTDKFMELNPKPAFWVDLDVDLYISAIQVLDFMCAKKLIQKDTILSFDDWGGTKEYAGGESLAMKESCEKYNMKVRQIHTHSDATGENVQKAFIVESIRA